MRVARNTPGLISRRSMHGLKRRMLFAFVVTVLVGCAAHCRTLTRILVSLSTRSELGRCERAIMRRES